MPKFLFEATYTQKGLEGLLSEGGSARRDAVAALAEAAGGKLESFYFAQGEADAMIIVELPDNASAAAISLTVGASGAVSAKTTALLTPEEVDEAAKQSLGYRPPGA